MLITDLFSHKIHSSSSDWPEKLIDIATIFNKFDGHPYDRMAIEDELLKISPRATKVDRDPSKFRDEISAYPAYLGLYKLKIINGVWHVFLSETAKQFLVNEEPDVAAFLLIQLALFQYPNGMGVAYNSGSSSLRIQANTKRRTLEFIKNGIHLSPLRLICKAILADSNINEVDIFESSISFEEIFILANDSTINKYASPCSELIKQRLLKIRNSKEKFLGKFESRFHILNHTNLFETVRSRIKLKKPITSIEKKQNAKKFRTLININNQFECFDGIQNDADLLEQLKLCSWFNYFDALKTINQENIFNLTYESKDFNTGHIEFIEDSENINIFSSDKIYKFKEINSGTSTKYNPKNKMYVDPELTKIKRQRANLTHKILLAELNEYFKLHGVIAFENEHIDIYAEFPSGQKFLFEIKSTTEDNILSQTRKGISQLYEYRFRYQEIIGYDVNLCLVYPHEPQTVPWIQEYLCIDRGIGVMWFEEQEPKFSEHCAFFKNLFTEHLLMK